MTPLTEDTHAQVRHTKREGDGEGIPYSDRRPSEKPRSGDYLNLSTLRSSQVRESFNSWRTPKKSCNVQTEESKKRQRSKSDPIRQGSKGTGSGRESGFTKSYYVCVEDEREGDKLVFGTGCTGPVTTCSFLGGFSTVDDSTPLPPLTSSTPVLPTYEYTWSNTRGVAETLHP